MSTETRQRIQLAAVVGCTALAAFALGQFTAGNPGATAKPGGGSAARTPGSSGAGAEVSPAAAAEMETELSRWFGAREEKIEDVLRGRSIEDHVKHLLAVDDEATRMLGFLRLLEAITDPAEIQEALAAIGTDRSSRAHLSEQAMLLQKWTAMDAPGAASYTLTLKDWARFNATGTVLRAWLKSSPDAAIAWADSNGAPAEGDGRAAREGNWAMGTLVDSLARTELDRALQLAATQPESRAQGRMVETLVNQLLSQRGQDAARSAVIDLPDDEFRASMAGRMADKLASGDPRQAAAWAATLPTGPTREKAVAEVIDQWARKDPVAAAGYLTQYGSLPDFDDARREFAGEVLREDPEGAMAWASSIIDPEQRSRTVRDLLQNWTRRDAPSAQRWAAANGMEIPATQDLRSRFFRGIAPGG